MPPVLYDVNWWNVKPRCVGNCDVDCGSTVMALKQTLERMYKVHFEYFVPFYLHYIMQPSQVLPERLQVLIS